MYGAPGNRITPDPAAAAQGAGQWGVQPSGPFAAIPGIGTPGRRLRRGAQLGRVGHLGVSQIAATDTGAKPLGVLPKAATLDYAHKLTTTTLLLAGVVGYLLFGPRRVPSVLSQLASRHVA